MTLMPNLHTVQIMPADLCASVGIYGIWRKRFQKAFAGLAFPSVKRVSLPDHASAIFGCLPEVVEVFANERLSLIFLDDMYSHCRKIEAVGWRITSLFGPGYSGCKYTCIGKACPWPYEGCSSGGKVSQSPQDRM